MVAVSLKKFFFQAEDGIRDVERSRGLGDVYKRQRKPSCTATPTAAPGENSNPSGPTSPPPTPTPSSTHPHNDSSQSPTSNCTASSSKSATPYYNWAPTSPSSPIPTDNNSPTPADRSPVTNRAHNTRYKSPKQSAARPPPTPHPPALHPCLLSPTAKTNSPNSSTSPPGGLRSKQLQKNEIRMSVCCLEVLITRLKVTRMPLGRYGEAALPRRQHAAT